MPRICPPTNKFPDDTIIAIIGIAAFTQAAALVLIRQVAARKGVRRGVKWVYIPTY